MKKALLSLAVAGLALTAAQASFAQVAPPVRPGGQNMLVRDHGTFVVVEAYPVTARDLDEVERVAPAGTIKNNRRFLGNNATQTDQTGQTQDTAFNVNSVPGILALASVNAGTSTVGGSSSGDIRQRLNVNSFVTLQTGYGTPTVQSWRLTKTVASSQKCPGTFPGATYIQLGGGIRTWWSLIYTPPGTTFRLDITVVGHGNQPATMGQNLIWIDRYNWLVGISYNSLRWVLDVLHAGALGTSEIPCIAAEDMYLALRTSISNIENATDSRGGAFVTAAKQDQLFKMEALLLAFSAFGDCFIAEDYFNAFPPSNDMQNGAYGWTGIIDTIENPCACKILVDIEKLAEAYGIVSTLAGHDGV